MAFGFQVQSPEGGLEKLGLLVIEAVSPPGATACHALRPLYEAPPEPH
jgi:hypothetical protein